jgi:hypothetical protein
LSSARWGSWLIRRPGPLRVLVESRREQVMMIEALLGRAVDVVSVGGLKSRDRAILAESVDL